MLFFSREATGEIYGLWVSSLIYFLLILFSLILNQKYKNTLLHFILFAICVSYPLQLYPVSVPISGAVTPKGLTTRLIRRVASICYLCAGAIHIVLRVLLLVR